MREIGDLISESNYKNVNESNKNPKKEKIEIILEKEMNDETIEIKAINATFHLIFLDFLFAFLEDRSEIIIKNDYNDNNKTKVYFYRSEQSPLQPHHSVKFVTYKDCFNEKYPQELKQFYKDQIILLIRGKLIEAKEYSPISYYNNDDDSLNDYMYIQYKFNNDYSSEQCIKSNNNNKNQTITEKYTNATSINPPKNENDKSENMDIEEEDNNTINELNINNNDGLSDVDQQSMFDEYEKKIGRNINPFENDNMDNLNSERNDTEVNKKDNEPKENEEKKIVNSNKNKTERKLIFEVVRPVKHQRKDDPDNAVQCIYNECMANVYNSIKDLLEKMKIYNFNLKKPSIDHLFKNSFDANRDFFEKKLGEIFKEFKAPNCYKENMRNNYKAEITKQFDKLLKEETNNHQKKILKAIFNKQYFDYLEAFLEDKQYIIIENYNSDEKEPEVIFDENCPESSGVLYAEFKT